MSNLALDLRPFRLEDVLGQESTKRAIKAFAEKDSWPNVFLFYGPPGTGKTTLARIVAQLAGAEGDGLLEINASDANGVDAARELAETSGSRPFSGRRRVIILNEFHQYTGPAQNVLKDPMEKSDTIWILTTDKPEKVEPAIKSRAAAATFELKPLNDSELCALLTKIDPKLLKDSVGKFLWEHGVRAPREILGAVDQYLSGVPIEDCIHGSEHEPLYPEIATATLSGNWTKTSGLLKQVKTADYRAMVAVVSAKMSWALLDEQIGPRADSIAACLVGIGVNQFADGVAYASLKALLYKCCKTLKGNN
jgi:energy-coupling factor transporter ATP-binding protein EcfA2